MANVRVHVRDCKAVFKGLEAGNSIKVGSGEEDEVNRAHLSQSYCWQGHEGGKGLCFLFLQATNVCFYGVQPAVQASLYLHKGLMKCYAKWGKFLFLAIHLSNFSHELQKQN